MLVCFRLELLNLGQISQCNIGPVYNLGGSIYNNVVHYIRRQCTVTNDVTVA